MDEEKAKEPSAGRRAAVRRRRPPRRKRSSPSLGALLLVNTLPLAGGLVILLLWLTGRISFHKLPENTTAGLAVLGGLLILLIFLCWVCLPIFGAAHRWLGESLRASRHRLAAGGLGALLALPGFLLRLLLYLPVTLNLLVLVLLAFLNIAAILLLLAALLFGFGGGGQGQNKDRPPRAAETRKAPGS